MIVISYCEIRNLILFKNPHFEFQLGPVSSQVDKASCSIFCNLEKTGQNEWRKLLWCERSQVFRSTSNKVQHLEIASLASTPAVATTLPVQIGAPSSYPPQISSNNVRNMQVPKPWFSTRICGYLTSIILADEWMHASQRHVSIRHLKYQGNLTKLKFIGK